MSDAKSTMERLQLDIAARLNSLAFFSDITVANVREQTVDTLVDQALSGVKKKAGKAGAAALVQMPRMMVAKRVQGMIISKIIVPVWALEFPIINHGANGTGKAPEEIAVEAGRRCNNLRLGYVERVEWADEAVRPLRDKELLPKIGQEILLQSPWVVTDADRCAAPDITAEAGTITLANNEAGAAVYYTTDESYPDTSATLYAAPFAAAGGTLIRAAAYLAGKDGSDVALLQT